MRDALYLPRATYHTGDLHTHDVVFAAKKFLAVHATSEGDKRISLPERSDVFKRVLPPCAGSHP